MFCCGDPSKLIQLEYECMCVCVCVHIVFPGSSASKESACNTGDPGLIPGSWRFPWEGVGFPLQYSWDSLVAQTVKNLPAIWETWVRSLGWEDPLEKGIATYPSTLAWRIQRQRSLEGYSLWGCNWGTKHIHTSSYVWTLFPLELLQGAILR